MWFKLFVLLRLPVSVICLLGYPAALSAWGGEGLAFLGGMLVVAPYIFLGVTSIKLVRRRNGALSLAAALLALETVGAVLLITGGDYMVTRSFDPLLAFAVAVAVIVVWALPNAALFYKARGKFFEESPKKTDLSS